MKDIFQYQGKVEPVFSGPETPQLDKWFNLLSEPRRFARSLAMAVVLAASGNFFVAPTEAPAETVTLDKYYQGLSEPDFRKNAQVYLNSSFVIDSSSLLNPEVPQLDKWYQEFSRPVLPINKLIASAKLSFSISAESLLNPEAPQLDKWYQELSKPTLRAKSNSFNLEASKFLQNIISSEVVTSDKWYQNFSEPLRLKPSLIAALKDRFIVDPGSLLNPEAPQLDKWYQNFSTPRLKLGLASHLKLDSAFVPTIDLEIVTSDKWYQDLSLPKPKPSLITAVKDSFVVDPRSLLNPEAPQLDKWYQELSKPVLRVQHFDPPAQLFQKDFIPETTQLDKWFGALSLPLKAKPNYSLYNLPTNFSIKPPVLFLNLSKTIREAILADSGIVALIGTWQGVGSVHTRRPVPSEAGIPMIVISGDISVTDEDSLTSFRPVVVKDVICYGDQPLSYRDVEEVGALLRVLFHRKRHLLSLEGWHIIDVTVEGPFVAPTDDDKTCARGVTLTIRLLDLRSV